MVFKAEIFALLAVAHQLSNDTTSSPLINQQMNSKSLDPAEYVEQMALLLDLQLDPEHRPGVVENFAKIIAIAQLVNEFPLPAEIVAAPVFEP